MTVPGLIAMHSSWQHPPRMALTLLGIEFGTTWVGWKCENC